MFKFFVFPVRSSIMPSELLYDALSPYPHPTGARGLELRVLRSFKNPYLRQAFLAGRVDEGRACFLWPNCTRPFRHESIGLFHVEAPSL